MRVFKRTCDSPGGRWILAAVLAVTLSACAQGRGAWTGSEEDVMLRPTASGLVGTEWVLEEFAGHGVLDYARATLVFPEYGKVAGNGSCNRFSGTVTITGESFDIGPLAATRRICPPAVMAQEIKYLQALEDSDRIVIDGPTLLIYTPAGQYPLRFSRKQ